jgi:hypothetical protein
MKTLRLTHPIDIDGAPVSSFVVGGPDGVVSIEPSGLGWDVTQVRGQTERTITVFPGGAVWGDWKPRKPPKPEAPPVQNLQAPATLAPLEVSPKRKPGRPRKEQP